MTSRNERSKPALRSLRATAPSGPGADVVMTMFGAVDVASLRSATTPQTPAAPRRRVTASDVSVPRRSARARVEAAVANDIGDLPDHAVTLLRELIEKQSHAVDVMRTAATLAKSPALAGALMANAEARRGQSVILRGLVLLNDESVSEHTHSVGPFRKAWMNVRRLFGGDDALAVIANEDHQAVLRAYEQALSELEGTTAHRVVKRQYVEMQERSKGLDELSHALAVEA